MKALSLGIFFLWTFDILWMSLMTAFPLLELAGFVSRININKISRRFFSYRRRWWKCTVRLVIIKQTNHWIKVGDIIFIWHFQQLVAEISKDYKSSPNLTKEYNYSSWEKELQIWKVANSSSSGKRTPAVFLTLTGEAKEATLNLEIEKLLMTMGWKKY